MSIKRRQALRNSTFALSGAVLAPQLVKAETAASKPRAQNNGLYPLKVGAFEVTVLNDGFFKTNPARLATNLSEAELNEFVKANHLGSGTGHAGDCDARVVVGAEHLLDAPARDLRTARCASIPGKDDAVRVPEGHDGGAVGELELGSLVFRVLDRCQTGALGRARAPE